MATYQAIEILDATSPNIRDGIGESFDRYGQLIGEETGQKLWDDDSTTPSPQRSFTWTADGRTEIGQVRTFLEARKGRLVPFWTPTYVNDLPLAGPSLAAASALEVVAVDYGEKLFPINARKHLAIVRTDGTYFIRKATLVVDNLDGTETITLDSGLGEDVAAATHYVSYLCLCRLDTDDVLLRWYHPYALEVVLPFRELPEEAPA